MVSSATQGYLGFIRDSAGTATVIGAGSKWITGHSLFVGGLGAGALTVSDGGEVVAKTLHASLSSLQGNGTITATGAVLDADLAFNATHGTSQSFAFGSGGTLSLSMSGGGLGVGYRQSGSLNISEGANVSSEFGYLGYLGYLPGSTGIATITGAGSKWTSGNTLRVGDSGHGTLTIAAGGTASSMMGLLGGSPGSTGTVRVTGAGSEWTSNSLIYVAHSGSGTLVIEAAGRVDSSGGNLGEASGSAGTATVTGIGSMWTTSNALTIGRYGNGSLAIEAGGLVNSFSGFLGQSRGSVGTATVTGHGSKWISRTGLTVGRYGNGTLTIEAGGRVSSGGSYLGDNPNASGTATVAGAGSVWAITSFLYVGETGNGELTIEDGGLVSVGGTLTIDNRSPMSQSFINMTTGGMLALQGNAADSLNHFLELVQGTDALRFWDNALAAWAPIASATAGEDYTLEYLATGDLAGYTLLTVGQSSSPGLAGDFNADGFVDGADFLAWQRGGSPTPFSAGDLNAWKTNFPALASGAANGASVAIPEPTTAALALVLPLAASHCRAAGKRRWPITA